jgi:hypothetical protein
MLAWTNRNALREGRVPDLTARRRKGLVCSAAAKKENAIHNRAVSSNVTGVLSAAWISARSALTLIV